MIKNCAHHLILTLFLISERLFLFNSSEVMKKILLIYLLISIIKWGNCSFEYDDLFGAEPQSSVTIAEEASKLSWSTNQKSWTSTSSKKLGQCVEGCQNQFVQSIQGDETNEVKKKVKY